LFTFFYVFNLDGEPNQAGQRWIRVPEAVQLVRAQIDEDPYTSVRKVARNLGMSKSSVHNIVKEYLDSHPFKKREGHQMLDGDADRRLAMCETIFDLASEHCKEKSQEQT